MFLRVECSLAHLQWHPHLPVSGSGREAHQFPMRSEKQFQHCLATFQIMFYGAMMHSNVLRGSNLPLSQNKGAELEFSTESFSKSQGR